METLRPAPALQIYAQGLLTQLVNPKVAVFFTALFPPFLDASRPLAPQVAALGVVYMGVAMCVDTAYVLTASARARRLLRSRAAQRTANRIAAGSYVGLGVAVAASATRSV
ncbi:MAG TPA: LysE family transporter [Candidatus Dormibacteraeota bacterium]